MANLTKRKYERKAPTTGQRKGRKKPVDENTQAHDGMPSHAVKTRSATRDASEVLHDSSNVDNDTENAALALVSLKKPRSPTYSPIRSRSPNWERDYHEMYHPNSPYPGSPTTISLSGGEDDDETDSSEDEEIDELADDSDLDAKLAIPVSSPVPLQKTVKEPFDIPIEVPYGNATRDVTGITSRSSFSHVLREIGRKMDATPSQLDAIGYIPSYKPRNPKPVPKLLEDETAWAKLISDVRQYIASFSAKKGAAKQVKPFVITIVDTSAHADKSGKDSKSGSSKKARKAADDSSDSGAAISKEDSRQLEALRRIEAHHMCQTHKKPCLVQIDGSHYQYTHGDLAKWSLLMAQGKALLGEPPEELGLTDSYKRQRKAKAAMNETLREQATISPSDMLQMASLMMMQTLTGRTPFVPQMSSSPSALPTAAPPPVIPTAGAKRPSSPIVVPSIETWAGNLSAIPGRKELDITEYLEAFEQNGIDDLEDLVDCSVDELIKFTGMTLGVAKRVLRYARADLEDIRHNKQARLE